VLNAVVMYQQRAKWQQWGLHNLRRQGAAILLVGPPGTGKTVIAEYLAIRIRKKGIKEISFADFGSDVPGKNSRQIRELFKLAELNNNMTIFLDECDAILWDRGKATGDSMWMLEIINEFLVQIGKYRGLVILASNNAEILDKALERRLLAIIEVPVPEFPERVRLWQSKIPETYPVRPNPSEVEKLATLQLTGAEVETIIINVSSDALRQKRNPTFKMLLDEATEISHKRTTT
jgi:SpoVK/Ycf46/Vps4 family AAA+-type ATPase